MRRDRLVLAALLSTLAIALSPAAGDTRSEQRETARAARGIALGLFADRQSYDYGALLEELHDLGAREVLLVITWYQDDATSSRVYADPDRTPGRARLARTISQARRLGMRVALMPIVRLRARQRHQWRGNMRPAPQAWLASYDQLVLPLSRLAQRSGVERLFIGSELATMVAHQEHWRALIAKVRARYRGQIGYSANWDSFGRVPFWDALDVIGVTGYFPMQTAGQPGFAPTSARRRWATELAQIGALGAQQKKPVLLTEVGYPSHAAAALQPWNDHRPRAALDLQLQAALVDVFCESFDRQGRLDGFYLWNWFGRGGDRDRSFSPRHKPAQASFARCMRPTSHPRDARGARDE